MAKSLARWKKGFAGDVLKLVTGTVFGQALAIVAAPILTRLYGPEAFGISTLFTSFTGIIMVVACLRYEMAIVVAETAEDAANVLAVALTLAVVVSLGTALFVIVAHDPLLGWLNAPELGPYLWLAPLSVLMGGVFLALNYWNTRTRNFGRLSIARVSSSAIGTGSSVGAGFAGYGSGGTLITTGMIGSFVSTAVLAGQIWRDDSRLFVKSMCRRTMREMLGRHRKFPLWSAWSGLLNTISWQLPAFLLAAFFSPAIVGYYALGTRVLRLPMNMVGSAIGQAFFPRAAEAKADGTLGMLAEKAFRRLVAIGMFPLLLLTLVGRDVFIVVFGAGWTEAGIYVQILAIWMFFWFVSSPISTLFIVHERQDLGLLFNVAILVTRLIALGIGGLLGDARLALILFGGSGILVYGSMCLFVLSLTGVPAIKFAKILAANFAVFLPAGCVLGAMQLLSAPAFLSLATALVFLAAYGLIILLHEVDTGQFGRRVAFLASPIRWSRPW